MTPIREEITKNLLYYRRKSGLSQKEFASLMGVSSSTVSTWETGAGAPDIELLYKACTVLKITFEDAFGQYNDLTQKENTPAADEGSEREREFTELFSKLSDEHQDLVLALLQSLSEKQ